MKRYIVICLLLMSGVVSAQTNQPTVKMIAKPREGTILLRWAPTSPMAWKFGNTYGYTIERYTITRAGKVLEKPEKKLMGQAPFKPMPLAGWQKVVDTSDYGAIVAQAIYGESFNTNLQQKGSAMDIVNRASELEQRFAYSLFSADRSFSIAKMAALGYVDKTVLPDEKYLYRVFVNVPVAKMKIDTGVVFTGLADEQPLPRPLDLGAMFTDKAAMLSWNYVLLKDVYNSYILEKSSGPGQPFIRVNKEPIVNVNEKDTLTPARIYYIDSLKANYNVYSYRVRGLDPFGEIGPVSDTVEGKGLPSLPYNPFIKKYNITGPQQVDLAWEFPVAGNPLITGFHIVNAPDAKGPYDTIQRNIPADARQFVLNRPLLPSNYMAIVAVGVNGTMAPSFPVLVQPEDTIPPAVPTGLQGRIDSTGKVFLHWNKNTEKDMFGYRVFRSNTADGPFVQLTVSPAPDTAFIDSVQLHTLHHKIYYKILSSDKRYNQSAFTAVLELTKPDKVLPSAPVFSHYDLVDGKVKLTWINSPDAEVVKYRLLRRDKAKQIVSWEVIKEFTNTHAVKDSLTDAPRHENAFAYTLQAVAADGLVSEYAPELTIIIKDDPSSFPLPVVKTLADRDAKQITVSWRYDMKGVKQFWLYRAAGDEPVSLLQVLDGSRFQFIDKNLTINKKYQYTIKVIMENGRQSRFAEINTVVY